jgi:hypothetical protein
MANFTEVPVFVKGEPGFAAKLNQLGAAVREIQEALTAQAEQPVAAEAPKTPTRRKATAKAE